MRPLLLAVALLFPVTLSAQSSRWVTLLYGSGESIAVDTTTTVRSLDGKGWTVWTKWTYTRPVVGDDKKPVKYALHRETVDCTQRQTRYEQVISYGTKGEVVSSGESPDAAWQTHGPDTMGEWELNALCARLVH